MTASDPAAFWYLRATTRVVVYLNGVATDITSYVLQPPRGAVISSNRGRQTELEGMDDSRLSLSLDNTDFRFTPNYAGSPYYPYWRMGARIVWTETLGHETFTHFDGFLELPVVKLNYQSTNVVDCLVTVTAVDTLTQLGRARPFPSTLGAYVEGDPTLMECWPLNDAAAPLHSATGGNDIVPTIETGVITGTAAFASETPVIGYQEVEGPLGDDGLYLRSFPVFTGFGTQMWPAFQAYTTSFTNVGVGETIALSGWVKPEDNGNLLLENTYHLFAINDTFGALSNFIQVRTDYVAETLLAQVYYDFGGGSASTVTVTTDHKVPIDSWQFITVRVTMGTGLVELWMGETIVASGTMSGTPPTTMDLDTVAIGTWIWGALAYVQVRVGVNAFPYADHLAQVQHGIGGLAYQLTGERIRTVLGFAGVSTSEMDLIDDGVTVMARASLKDKSPLEVMDEAAVTDRGRLFTNGPGDIVFQDRRSIYNS